jgi:hypothetical protein
MQDIPVETRRLNSQEWLEQQLEAAWSANTVANIKHTSTSAGFVGCFWWMLTACYSGSVRVPILFSELLQIAFDMFPIRKQFDQTR